MNVKQFYLDCLSHASYLVVDEGTRRAVVIDPQRDIAQYLEEAARQGATITHVVLTHFHADFVAGHLELRERVGAEVCLGARAQAGFEFRALKDGDVLELGATQLEVLETPGHTPEGISLVLREREGAAPFAVFTGDTLFAGDVGRPDLLASLGVTADELATMLYDSLHGRLLKLPDETIVYPAHGAGSMCGKNLSADPRSTIGHERSHNPSLQIEGREAFVAAVTQGQPQAPAYFGHDAIMNREQHPTLSATLDAGVTRRSLEEVLRLQAEGAQVVDVREAGEFAAAHLVGSLNIGLGGSFATWAGTVLDPRRPIVLIAPAERELEAVLRLGRIGFEAEVSVLDGGVESFTGRPELVRSFARLTAEDLAASSDLEGPVIDVRAPGEYASGHVVGSRSIPLNQLAERLHELPRDQPLALVCRSGYRSSLAASLLQAAGFDRVRDLEGGMLAWADRGLPVEGAPACSAGQRGSAG